VACGLRPVACGLWPVACGLWPVARGLWPVVCNLESTAWGLRPRASQFIALRMYCSDVCIGPWPTHLIYGVRKILLNHQRRTAWGVRGVRRCPQAANPAGPSVVGHGGPQRYFRESMATSCHTPMQAKMSFPLFGHQLSRWSIPGCTTRPPEMDDQHMVKMTSTKIFKTKNF
jgi:hypothetical protein